MTDALDGNKIGLYDQHIERANLLFSLLPPVQAGVNPSGDLLMGPENIPTEIHVFTVGLASLNNTPWVMPISHSCTPVSFAFNRRGRLSITEPSRNGVVGDPHTSIVSSYTNATGGSLEAIRASRLTFRRQHVGLSPGRTAISHTPPTMDGERRKGGGRLTNEESLPRGAHLSSRLRWKGGNKSFRRRVRLMGQSLMGGFIILIGLAEGIISD
jgi:hypothetical protein